MPKIAHTAQDMIAGMTPVLLDGQFVFARSDNAKLVEELATKAVATIREAEGLSLILPENDANSSELETSPPMRCITLNVYSSLEGVGLTAAVATALGAENIACNMVAGFHHDNVFVPAHLAARALLILLDLQG